MKIYNFNVVICWDWSVLKSFNHVAVLSWWGSHKTSASSQATRDGFQISVFKNMWDGMLNSWNNYPSWEWYEHPRNASLFSIKSILWSIDYYRWYQSRSDCQIGLCRYQGLGRFSEKCQTPLPPSLNIVTIAIVIWHGRTLIAKQMH